MIYNVSLEEFVGKIGSLPHDVEKAIVRGLRNSARRGAAVAVEMIGTRNPNTGTPAAVDEGTLMRSVESSTTAMGGQIVADAPHAAIVEFGTRPHMPPKQPLVDWAKRKFQVDDDEAEEIAEAVRWKIKHYGTKPRLYMQRTVRFLQQRVVPQEIVSELSKLP